MYKINTLDSKLIHDTITALFSGLGNFIIPDVCFKY